MSGLILLGIFVSIFVLSVVGVLMFVDVAWAGPRGLGRRRLPLLSGEPLKNWAALRSRVATGKWLKSHPERTPSDQLARQIERDASELLDQAIFATSPQTQGVRSCHDSGVPQATCPEIFAIADEVRKLPFNHRRQLVKHVSDASTNGSATCPLLTKQGMCLCAIVRPVGCRGRCLAGFDSSEDAMAWANALEEGMSEGLQQGLNAAGLDGRCYDLNAGLAQVLTDPTAEDRWLRGEPLLATPTVAASH